MKFQVLFPLFVALLASSTQGAPSNSNNKNFGAVFSLKVLDALEQQNGGVAATENLVVCPVALENILDVLLLGAEGNTAKQIQVALAETSSVTKRPRIRDPTDYVQITNLLGVQSQYPFKQSFLDAANSKYSASLLTENFQSAAHKSTQDLNSWLSGKTGGNVSDFFNADLMTDTKLVLLNAVHFVATWQVPIFAEFTQKSPFELANGKIIHADTMQGFAYYNYASFADGELLQIPFRDQGISMLFFLPSESAVTKGKSFASIFSEVPLETRIAALSGIYVYLYLPTFTHIQTSTSGVSLKQQLTSLGVTDAFSEKDADFSGIDGKKDLYLRDVLQQVRLKVDEQGTRADGAGAGDSDLGAGGGIFPTPATVNMYFNRTFLYMVHDAAQADNPLTLFTGVVHNPTLYTPK